MKQQNSNDYYRLTLTAEAGTNTSFDMVKILLFTLILVTTEDTTALSTVEKNTTKASDIVIALMGMTATATFGNAFTYEAMGAAVPLAIENALRNGVLSRLAANISFILQPSECNSKVVIEQGKICVNIYTKYS